MIFIESNGGQRETCLSPKKGSAKASQLKTLLLIPIFNLSVSSLYTDVLVPIDTGAITIIAIKSNREIGAPILLGTSKQIFCFKQGT